MAKADLPTMEELERLARTTSFEEIEKQYGVVDVGRTTARHGYPRSKYYVAETHAEVARRTKAVRDFLASFGGRKPR